MADKLNLDPESIVNKEFAIDFKGYNPDQVDHMLDQVIEDYQTYDAKVRELNSKIEELTRTNASLRAKLIDVQGKVKAHEDDDPMLSGSSNVDILKRLSRLEEQVFDNQNRK
jgi:DivIVA domain-containing protein